MPGIEGASPAKRGLRWGTRLGFGSYDFSNSGYVLIFQSFLFPIVVVEALAGRVQNPDAWWGWLVAGSTLAAIVLAPFVGLLADRIGRARMFALLVVATGIMASIAPVALASAPFLLVLAFLVFNSSFELSQSVYDSFLKDLAPTRRDTIDLSAFAWGFGYVGGAIFAVGYLALDAAGVSPGLTLTICGLAYLLFSVPSTLFFWARAGIRREQGEEASAPPARALPRNPVSWSQLAIYWLTADVVAAIMYFAPMFLTNEVGLSLTQVGGLLLGAQLVAFPLTIVVGGMANRVGHLLVLRGTIVVWAVGLLGLALATTLAHVLLVLVPMAFVVGSTQALLRAHFAMNVPVSAPAEGFGFYAVAQKSASVVSPALVAITITVTGGMRWAFAVLAVILILAFVLTTRLPEPEPVRH